MKILAIWMCLLLMYIGSAFAQDEVTNVGDATIAGSSQATSPKFNSTESGEPQSFWPALFKHNPGVVTTLLTAVLVPVLILWLTNRHGRKVKDMEHDHAKDLEKLKRELELANKNKSTKRDYENTVHACLVKILFAVQQLHVNLSKDCSQIEVASQASQVFSSTLNEYQQKIADNQISLSARNNTSIYSFYQILSEMLIELNSLCASKKGDLAHVSVYEHAKRLADEVISLQENILRERKELAADFDRAHLEKMRHCCGAKPSPELLARYAALKNAVAELPIDLPTKFSAPNDPTPTETKRPGV